MTKYGAPGSLLAIIIRFAAARCIPSFIASFHAPAYHAHEMPFADNVSPIGSWEQEGLDEIAATVPDRGDGFRLACQVTIVGDVTVGHDSVIGANAVVVTSFPPHSRVAGVPARAIAKAPSAVGRTNVA